MTKTKNYEVYTEFEPWMIGETVEVGLYLREDRKDPDDDYSGSPAGTMGGVLKSYFTVPDGKTGMRLNGDDSERKWDTVKVAYLVSVIEEPR